VIVPALDIEIALSHAIFQALLGKNVRIPAFRQILFLPGNATISAAGHKGQTEASPARWTSHYGTRWINFNLPHRKLGLTTCGIFLY
jgi:hypothetical protein